MAEIGDSNSRPYILNLEGRLKEANQDIATAKREKKTLEDKLENATTKAEEYRIRCLKLEGVVGAIEPDEELGDYVKTNRELVDALQKIADGKGKYSKIAKDALGI